MRATRIVVEGPSLVHSSQWTVDRLFSVICELLTVNQPASLLIDRTQEFLPFGILRYSVIPAYSVVLLRLALYVNLRTVIVTAAVYRGFRLQLFPLRR
jgi:hypothetical protein